MNYLNNINNLVDSYSPLDQFTIRDLISVKLSILGITLSLTTIGLYLILSNVLAITLVSTNNYGRLIANRWSIAFESIYVTVLSMVTSQINMTTGQRYFPWIFVLFIFILTNNLIGMIPYSFSPTSHFILTFFMSFSVVIGSTILGLTVHKLRFFCVFVPAGCPLALLPLLVLIETLSYISRNISLGLRLGANVLSGHMLLNILSGFTYKIFNSSYLGFILALVPAAFIAAFCALEIAIAFIQAQVFCVLSASYIKDGLISH